MSDSPFRSNDAAHVGIGPIVAKRRWWILVLLGLIVVPSVYAVFSMTLPLIAPPSDGSTDSWWTILFADVIIVVPLAILCWMPIPSLFTRFTGGGITQPTIRGRKIVHWSDIQGMDANGQGIRLRTSDDAVVLNLRVFDDPEPLVDEIVRRVLASRVGDHHVE